MFKKILAGSLVAASLAIAGAAYAYFEAQANQQQAKDCCAAKLACCSPKSACCAAEAKLGCCEKGQKCCAERRACCNAPQKCCELGSACCEKSLPCCGAKGDGQSKAEASAKVDAKAPSCCAAKST